MNKSAFVCFGTDERKNSLIYQELPRKASGEELFIFLSPGNPQQEDRLRILFRDAISSSRLGHPINYFAHFIYRLERVTDENMTTEDLLSGTLVMIMIRRGEELYLLSNRDAELLHWNSDQGNMEPIDSFPEIRVEDLGKGEDQRDLFRLSVADRFILHHINFTAGNHAVLLVPSKEFAVRHMEALKNSVFFPSFEVPADVGVEIETSRTFPAIHWSTGSGKEGEIMDERRGLLKKLSFPMVAGILTGMLAILYFFGPLRKGEPEPAISDPAILLSTKDAAPAAEREDAERRDEHVAPIESAERAVTLREAWKKEFSKAVTSSPVCHEGRVIFGCRDGALYAFSAAGEPLWKHPTGNGIGASPVCVDDRVIAANYDGDVFCLNVASGENIWSFRTNAKIVSTPQVRGNLVVVGTMEGRLTAIDLQNGMRLWSQKLGTAIWANASIGDAYIIAATMDGSLIKLKHDGSIVWRTSPGGGILSSPLCIDEENLVIFGTKNKYLYAYSLTNGDLMWRHATGDEANGSPATDGESIYIGSQDGSLYALTTRGQLKWKQSLGGPVLSRPLVIDSTIYVTTYASKLAAIDTESGEVIGQYKTSSPVYSSPAHDERRIFFGSNTGIFYSLWLYGASG